MFVMMMKSKIHRATVTEANLNYAGSLTLDPLLIEAAGLFVNERIQVVNINTGDRFETYVIAGERGKGTVCLNGAAARLGHPGDLIIAIAYASMTPEEAKAHVPRIVHVDAQNHVLRVDASQD
ncbi:MAG TPA: aspartate 1-decarboxylase [Candidatus Hydrogenedentes bacterium]|nr:aspartate 1-decarboxylase [Candidatus Hydrogenedentota bacterium]HOV72622.1 aspartate 1-decarboxylase [Candidatus Hydrogenedentota bacterium]HPC16506.1 aspartate 1-decarboxylase [Candidatus Hydrogenedentota bacterium]HRT21608.1 aspartate 1-decarboxylase [Candidatus Hydrogenedentota bacterium]HRT63251.1 aspartate 1-decarboxylase [Candidatus Hydrogenedentota bacterium]